jgi:hypothetical protein
MAPKSQVMEGDVLATSKDGYAQIKMNDGTKMTLRPESNLKIEAYQFKKETPQADNAIYRLLKGGFRTVTGLIGKRGNQDAYKLHAASATIGIRGTDFTTRLCNDDDCLGTKVRIPTAKGIGRVMLVNGNMTAKDVSGTERKLVLGSPVFESDTLNTEAKTFAIVAFRDESRVTLQENTSFYVEKYKYDKATAQENAILKLLKGGVRVVTGLIGRNNHDNYKFGMGGATIGIRGTGFDAWCRGACASGGNPGATQDNPLDGAGVYVWSGAVVLITPQGSFDVAIQKAAIIARETGKPVPIVTVPKSIIENDTPKPDSIPVDFDKEFNDTDEGNSGLYVTVHEGKVVVMQDGKELKLDRGETGFAHGKELRTLPSLPGFMDGSDENDDPNPSVNPQGCAVR